MPTVKVRMKVAQAGPGVFRRPGFVYELEGEEAGSLVAAGYATLEPTPPKLTPADAPPKAAAPETATAAGAAESTSGAPAERPDAPPAAGGKPKGGRRGGRA